MENWIFRWFSLRSKSWRKLFLFFLFWKWQTMFHCSSSLSAWNWMSAYKFRKVRWLPNTWYCTGISSLFKWFQPRISLSLAANEEVSRCRPDIWFYKIEETCTRNEPTRTMKCKLVEITVPRGDAYLWNKDENEPYTGEQVKKDKLLEAWIAKQHKYVQIKERMTQWLENYKAEIKSRYGVDNILVEDFYIVVSSRCIASGNRNLLYLVGRGKRKTLMLWMKRVIIKRFVVPLISGSMPTKIFGISNMLKI
jgi:hypothetical protein